MCSINKTQSGGTAPSFLTSALDEWLGSRPGRFISWEGNHGIHWGGGWVGPGTGLNSGIEKNVRPLPGIEPAVLPIARRYSN
jgi:hypothetical protein